MTSPAFTAGRAHVESLARALERFGGHVDDIDEWGTELAQRMLAGARLLTVGNGGSAAQAQHLSSEIVGRYCADRPAFSAVALHSEPSALTAILNDYGIDEVFARQVSAHGRAGDVLVAMSTSGTSANVVAAAIRARSLGIAVWAVTGPAPNPLADVADRVLAIEADETSTVQELSLVALHMICAAFDENVPAAAPTVVSVAAPAAVNVTAAEVSVTAPAVASGAAAEVSVAQPAAADTAAIAPLVVIGDLLLDIDVVGAAHRLSPEAPVPVLSDPVEHPRPGGAGLAAVLAARSHDRVVLIAPVADDDDARRLVALLPDAVELIPVAWTGSTSVKTRIRAGDHPLTRLDRGGRAGQVGPLPAAAHAVLAQAAAVLVADYGLGCCAAPEVRAALTGLAGHTPIVWDPHPRGPEPVPGVRLVTPNAREAASYAGVGVGVGEHDNAIAAAAAAAAHLSQRWSAGGVVVTMGAAGALLFTGAGAPLVVPAPSVAASDTCGAGDAFSVATALALADGALPSEAVTLAVHAAADFVALGGAAALAVNADPGAVATPSTLELVDQVRAAGGRIVATGGCFDLLHAGHIATLEAARALGDCLVVCLNSDESVRRLKGANRPLQTQADRAHVLTALRCVDAVAVFTEDTPAQVLRSLRPDVWVKGGDYAGADLPEAAVLAEWGGAVVAVPYLSGRSTTALVERSRVPARG